MAGKTGGSSIRALVVTCTTTISSNGTHGWSFTAGQGGNKDPVVNPQKNTRCLTSIRGATVWYDFVGGLYGIQPKCDSNHSIQNLIGIQGVQGSERDEFMCPKGTNVVGIHGYTPIHPSYIDYPFFAGVPLELLLS